MATARYSESCLRAVSSTKASWRTSSASATAQSLRHPQRHFHTPSPHIYLDFLAPSWPASHTQPKLRQDSIPKRALYPSFHTQRSRPFSTTIPKSAIAITNPRTDDTGAPMTITITPRASHRLQTISEKDGNPDLALRVSVESGGCHGFQYLMSLVSVKDADPAEDTVFENEEPARKVNKSGGAGEGNGDGSGVYKAKVVMDEPSLELLKGSSIDYTMELIGSQFKVTGIPGATSSCGCGTSFDIA